jgi:DNA modification methylase/ParB-like chromosome segregation protein Spo0J
MFSSIAFSYQSRFVSAATTGNAAFLLHGVFMIYESHEYANLFPMMLDDDFSQLKTSMSESGYDESLPIVLFNGLILDGRNRYKAANELNVTPLFTEFTGTDEQALSFVLRHNLNRRHLNASQKAALAVKLLPIFEEQAKARQGKRTDLKDNETTDIVANLPQSEIVKDSPAIERIKENTVSIKSREQAAAVTGASARYVSEVKKIAEESPELFKQIESGQKTIQEVKKEQKSEKLEEKKQEIIAATAKTIEEKKPVLYCEHYRDFFNRIENKSQDLLITDPPYSTDVDDIAAFANDWLLPALGKVKDNGRAYICIGAYPKELQAYLNLLLQQDRFIVDNPLIWTYRNTLGITPKDKYNLNYQVILHLYGKDSAELDTSITNEMFSVQDINAPDGRQGDRYHTWQKPLELGLRLIRHSTKENDFIFDPFSCTGTFAIAAAKLNRNATGCDISEDNLKIAESRGCNVVY